MADSTYDVIVLGVGSMGSSACYHLAKRGYRVLGLEQFDIPHDQGSHAGQTRIIRKAYGENVEYVPMLERAYENWRTLESETGEQLYYQSGIAYFGGPGNEFLETVRTSSRDFGIPVRELTGVECRAVYPQFRLPKDFVGIEEPDAGFLLPEECVRQMASEASKHGANIRTQEKTHHWDQTPKGVVVTTDKATYEARKLVITAGAWAEELIPGLPSPLKVTRQVLAWVKPKAWEDFTLGSFPCWLTDDDDKVFYGFPILPTGETEGPSGLKLGMHHPFGETADPNSVKRSIDGSEEQVLIDFLNDMMPNGYEETIELKTCLYTNTPDLHFIVDYLPGYDTDVAIAAGFSGHGFKFASAVGEVLADLAMEGGTGLPIDFLSTQRFNTV